LSIASRQGLALISTATPNAAHAARIFSMSTSYPGLGTDQQDGRNDARGIAQMMRVGLYRPVHVKTLRSQKLRMLLTHRKLLQSKAIAIENDLRGTLRNFGRQVSIGRGRSERQNITLRR
jgi:transposase